MSKNPRRVSDPNRRWRSRVHSVWGQFLAQLAANRREALGPQWTAAEKRAHSSLRGLGPYSSPSGANTCVRPHLPEQLHPKRPARVSAEADTGKPAAQRTPRSRPQPAAVPAHSPRPRLSALTAVREIASALTGARLGAAPGPETTCRMGSFSIEAHQLQRHTKILMLKIFRTTTFETNCICSKIQFYH